MANKKILVDSWYSSQINHATTNLEDHISRKFSRMLVKLSAKNSLIKNVLFFYASKKFDIVVAPLWPGIYYFLMLEALFSKKRNRVVLLEFIREVPQSRIIRFFYPTWVKYFFIPVLRRTILSAQVLSIHEIDSYAEQFKVSKDRFHFIPWPLHFNKVRDPESASVKPFQSVIPDNVDYVMVSGLGNVDWETIFKVAEKSDWQLLAVCTKKHLSRVNGLNNAGKAIVLNNLSQYEHGLYVKRATVYALCLKELGVSVGQMRLMNTIEHGVPVVATDVLGLKSYAVDGINSLLVPPGDIEASKIAIDKLMYDTELRDNLIRTGKEHQTGRTFENYLEQISKLIMDSEERHV